MTKETKKIIERQFCPTCKRYVKVSSRYPNYVCSKCISLATDKSGKAVEFCNTELSGHGCIGRYKDSGKDYTFKTCYIKGIKCKADEAYTVGIVLIPISIT
jgi:hypothetical protein